MIDLTDTTPNMISERLREAEHWWLSRAAETNSKNEDNPIYVEMCGAVSKVLHEAAAVLDHEIEVLILRGLG